MASLPSLDPAVAAPTSASEAPDALQKRHKKIYQQADACKQHKKTKLISIWDTSVSYRKGKPLATYTEQDRVTVNLDWVLTNQKQASLFSQVAPVRVSHAPETLDLPWLHMFETKLNDNLVLAGVEAAMEECLPDCINAAGIGIVLVARDALTEMVDMPSVDMSMYPPDIQAQITQTGLMPDGSPVPPPVQVPKVIDSRYTVTRVSPANFLWPLDFTASDFDKSPWLGRTGRVTWAEAVQRWNLDETKKSDYVSEDETESLSKDADLKFGKSDEVVSFDEIFYREHMYDPKSKSFTAIHHLVFVGKSEKPVVDEPWSGQQPDPETGKLLGVQRYPIRVLTLTYITDEAIPPSDSAIGRAQINEINKGRTQNNLQREHSIPGRWVDVNRIDPAVLYSLMRGVWQPIIPIQGAGQNVIGELGRSNMHQENFMFDRIAKGDLTELWQVGGFGPDIETKGEAQELAATMRTRMGKDRARVARLYCSIAEVLAGLMCIYEDPASFGKDFSPVFSQHLSYSVLADSTVLLDSQQKLKRLTEFMNFTAKSGWVNLEPVLKEIATLSGLDASTVIRAPEPKKPAEPNISLRLTGSQDLLQPMTVAMMIDAGQGPKLESIEKAKELIKASVIPPEGTIPGDPMIAQDGQLMPVPDPNAITPLEHTPPPTPLPGQDNPQWHAMPRVRQRVLDRESNQGEEQ